VFFPRKLWIFAECLSTALGKEAITPVAFFLPRVYSTRCKELFTVKT
jgi:hypothetical protein